MSKLSHKLFDGVFGNVGIWTEPLSKPWAKAFRSCLS